MARRHQSLIPLSHEHHDGLMLAWRLRTGDLSHREQALKAKHAVTFFDFRLVRHFKVEEDTLFPALRGVVADAEALLAELVADHRTLADKAALIRAGAHDEVAAFCDLLERHIRAEERKLFPLIENGLSSDSLSALGPMIKQQLELR